MIAVWAILLVNIGAFAAQHPKTAVSAFPTPGRPATPSILTLNLYRRLR